MIEIQKQYETETGKKWWINPVAHGELAFASAEYQEWLEAKVSQIDCRVKPACGYCRDCKFESKTICHNPTNRQMLILEDDEQFYIYPKFSCNKFESKSV